MTICVIPERTSQPGDKVFWYVLNGKGGFLDIAGRRLTRPKYKKSWQHYLGYAKVFNDKGWGMVDAQWT